MALTVVDVDRPSDASLATAIGELQGLTVSVVNGTTALTNISVTGIDTPDTILSVLGFQADTASSGAPVAAVTDATVTSTGHIQTAATNTSGLTLVVIWFNKP